MFNNRDPPPQQLVSTFFYSRSNNNHVLFSCEIISDTSCTFSSIIYLPCLWKHRDCSFMPAPAKMFKACLHLPCETSLFVACVCHQTRVGAPCPVKRRKSLFFPFPFLLQMSLQTFQKPKLNLMFFASGCVSVTTSRRNNHKTYK